MWAGENEVFGPMAWEELMELAGSAYISPEDELSEDGEKWKPAHEWEALGMKWTVELDGDTTYGPTTTGTLKEFLLAGEISPDHKIREKGAAGTKSLKEVLGEDEIKEVMEKRGKEVEEAAHDESIDSDSGFEESLEVARDLRIQQLEADLEKTKKDYEMLMHQYRRVSEELLKLKSAK